MSLHPSLSSIPHRFACGSNGAIAGKSAILELLIAVLFGVTIPTINEHIKNIYAEGELEENSTIRKFLIVQKEGTREIERQIDFYNLDMIISVGYRVKSGDRIDSGKKNLGLTNFRGVKPTKEEVVIAKNYYTAEELKQLNALVEQYLIFATEQACRRVPMTMNDWIKKLHGFLTINDRNILQDVDS